MALTSRWEASVVTLGSGGNPTLSSRITNQKPESELSLFCYIQCAEGSRREVANCITGKSVQKVHAHPKRARTGDYPVA